MSLEKRPWLWPLLVILPVLALGCRGGTPTLASRSPADLREIHEVYQHFIKNHQKPPAQLSDLTQKQYEGIYPAAINALKTGKYVFVYNVAGEDSGKVLAYPKDAPTQGGTVLMADGTVREMTADALNAALPAK
jgi:hypothetical protein